MTGYQKPEADWPQPFPLEEYATRRQRVSTKLAAAGFDGILITNPADIYYLTGYDMIWFHLRYITSCLLVADTSEVVFFDYPGHHTIVHTTPAISSVKWMTRETPEVDANVIASAMGDAGLSGKRVAVQRWGYVPHTDVMDVLISVVRDTGIVVDDGSQIVEEIRLVKTPLEVECLRQAAQIADKAMIAARDLIAPGVMETELQAIIMHTMMNAGGGDPGIRCMIGSGPRSGTHHSPPQHRTINNGELVFIDFCSSLHRYHVNLNRTYALGKVDERWFDLMARSSKSIEHIVANIEPGDKWSRVQELGDEMTDKQGIRDKVWLVGGYALGIAMPPDWVGEYRIAPLHGLEDRLLEPGMIFNFEGQFDVREGWAGGTGVAYVESLLMTNNGLEIMSDLPRTLETVSG